MSTVMWNVTYSISLTELKIQLNSLKVFVIYVNFFKLAQKEEIFHSKFKENKSFANSKDKHLKKL